MTRGQIEHVNLQVSDIARSARFFEQLLGWRQRWRGPAMNGGETIHVGEDRTYLALYTDRTGRPAAPGGSPFNHVGLLVDDIAAAEQVVIEHGFEPFNHASYEPGQRFYFRDWDGIEFEVIAYG